MQIASGGYPEHFLDRSLIAQVSAITCKAAHLCFQFGEQDLASSQEVVPYGAATLAQRLFMQRINVFERFTNVLQMPTPGITRRAYSERGVAQYLLQQVVVVQGEGIAAFGHNAMSNIPGGAHQTGFFEGAGRRRVIAYDHQLAR